MSIARVVGLMAATLVVVAHPALAGSAAATFVGPVAYLSAADNPFTAGSPGLCIDTFEDGTLDPEGVTGNGSFVAPGGITDSVDGDDGVIDGSGNGGHSYFGSGPTGITFTFNPLRTGGLPTQAGMVWTDGEGTISFEAFDENALSLGVIGPFSHADGTVAGLTAEDRFYGVTNAGGITAIKLTNTAGGIEVDHLTLNNTAANCVLPATTSTTSSTTNTTSTDVPTTTSSSSSTSSSTTTTTSTSSSSTSSSTSTALPTSTTRSTSTSTSTSSTTLQTGCGGVPDGPTFASIDCRLAALITAVQSEPQLGKQQSKLDKAAQTAKAREEAAAGACGTGNAKKSGKQLKKVVGKLTQFSHRLRSNNSRKNIPEGVREPLAEDADGIQADANTLKGQLSCAASPT
jgi:hypothetical protein